MTLFQAATRVAAIGAAVVCMAAIPTVAHATPPEAGVCVVDRVLGTTHCTTYPPTQGKPGPRTQHTPPRFTPGSLS